MAGSRQWCVCRSTALEMFHAVRGGLHIVPGRELGGWPLTFKFQTPMRPPRRPPRRPLWPTVRERPKTRRERRTWASGIAGG